jgi:hypothetical protein
MMSNILYDKMDALGRYQLAKGMLKGIIEVLVRMEAPLTPQQQKELGDAGFNFHFATGNVFSGTIADATRLEQIARLPFVRKIELALLMSEA